jgi:phthiocerol/phenolphthiocerol synthesis type-I polyketide synthase E
VVDAVEPIAVVGTACRFPGARDVEQFWRNLVEGRESITFFGADELRAAGVPEEDIANPDHVPAAPLMPDVDMFDAELFGMTAAEAELCDPQIRVFLELCHAALEDAGYDPFTVADSVGVYGTAGPNVYLYDNLRSHPGAGGIVAATTNHTDYLATRVSHVLGLRGPSIAVQTACSSSLVAVHLAAQALRVGECDAALAGGAVVDLPLGSGYRWTPGGVQSADGHCRPFDAAGSGTIFGSGAGVVVLKRLDDAVAAGDHVRAILRGSAVNNDGSEKVSYSAPSVSGQSAAIVEAMTLAGALPTDIDYVEAHATGTTLGDPVEVAALAEAYAAIGEPPPAGSIAIGSVKSNIGHMGAVAGIAGLIKLVLMLERQAIVPSINVDTVNPRLELEKTPFTVATTLEPWRRRPERPRLAGISSLGVGGTNAHLVLAEGLPDPVGHEVERPSVVLWSARSEQGVTELGTGLGRYLGGRGRAVFADAAATLQHGRTAHPVRAAMVCTSADDAVAALEGGRTRVITGPVRHDVRTAMLFPGQGAERAKMAAGLYGTVRTFSIAMDECIDLFEAEGVRLYDVWTAGEELPDDPTVVQALLFSVEYALGAMWTSAAAGVDAVLGHSLGELVAATVAGVFDLPDAVRVVAARAAAMAAAPCEGRMLAVAAPFAELSDVVRAPVVLAAVDSPRQTVLSGTAEALAEVAARLAERRVATRFLPVTQAFHHPGWRAAADSWLPTLRLAMPRPPRLPLYSGRTGAVVSPEQAVDPAFWADQLVHPVRFWPALDALLAGAERTLLEVGQGRTLTALARQHPAVAAGRVDAVTCLPGTGDDVTAVLGAAARLWVRGSAVDWAALEQPTPSRRVSVPGYPYQRRRYWIDPPPGDGRPAAVATPAAVTVPATVPDSAVDGASPVSAVRWVERERPSKRADAGGTVLVLLPADEQRAVTVLSAVQRAGLRTVRVRPGDAFAERAGEFTVDLGRPDDLDRVVSALASRGVAPAVMVHAAALAPFATPDSRTLAGQVDTAFTSLLALARLALRHPPGPAPRLFVVTSESVDVSGGDRVAPAKAMAAALVRTVRAEAPGTVAKVIDVGARVPVADLAQELGCDAPADLVALRGTRRWEPVERPLPIGAEQRDVLRERGVYLITGGFGGLGLALARALYSTGLRPRLVLMGRRNPVDDPDLTPEGKSAREAVSALVALGAEVLPAAGDVGDAADVRRVLDEATRRFGPVTGVFHLAGVPGDQMVAFRQPAAAAKVLHPKVRGSVVLLEAFADRPAPDFVVLFSSRAGTDGLVGCGDYAAANAFLDALAVTSPPAGGRILSIGWPVWQGPGMVDPDGPDIAGLADTVARLARGDRRDSGAPPPGGPPPAPEGDVVWTGVMEAATHWVLDEHRVDRRPLMPGTGFLDLVVGLHAGALEEPGRAVELTDVVFRAPFHDARARRLRVVTRPAGAGHEFTVSSQPADDPTAPWLDHAGGRVRTVSATPAVVDVAAVQRRIEASGPLSPAAGGGGQFALGPRWQNVRESWRTESETLARIELPAAFAGDLAQHQLHPALLDTATASVRPPGDESSVPFLYGRMVVHSPLPASFHCHARRRRAASGTALGDVDLIAGDGTVVVAVERFTMRRRDLSGPAADRPAPPAAPAAPAPAEGLAPDDGVRLMLALLGSPVPPAVLVRPRGVPMSPSTVDPLSGGVADAVASPGADRPGERGSALPAAVRLRGLWAEVLGAEPAHDDEDFFDVGGNSLAAVELMARIRAVFGLELSIGMVLEGRTFGELRALLAEHGVR